MVVPIRPFMYCCGVCATDIASRLMEVRFMYEDGLDSLREAK
jgi:hypothetical protein